MKTTESLTSRSCILMGDNTRLLKQGKLTNCPNRNEGRAISHTEVRLTVTWWWGGDGEFRKASPRRGHVSGHEG